MASNPRTAPQVENPPRVHAVDHVSVEVPLGREAEICRFYGELLGLQSLPTSAEGGLTFGRDRLAIRFLPCERPRILPGRRRMTLTVESLADVQERLDAAKCRYWTASGLSLSERSLLVVDPFDYVVELRQSQSI